MNVSGVVLINSQQVVSLHIAHKIRAKNHARTDFTLDAGIDLH